MGAPGLLKLLKRVLPPLLLGAVCVGAQAEGVSAEKLSAAIAERVQRVEEFRYLGQACQELRVRCWLFGGTASGFGHYVNWNLALEGGDTRYQGERFDYDYTSVFQSTQDADLVIDGSVSQAELLEARMMERFPHFQGNKSVWEVRLLREARGDKEALLANPDFLNQHTDSNSTGMIEVTRPPEGESAVRDLRDWRPAAGAEPQFLRDIRERRLHFYFSPRHHETSRFKAGKNPPIIAAIRYLTKAFQYDLEMRPEDLETVRKIIAEFDPKRDLKDRYVAGWVEKNGKKLFRSAVNLEYAWNRLEELGLRRRLIALGNPSVEDSLAWWMSKEPLRTLELGGGKGKTAEEIFRRKGWLGPDGELLVSHEAKTLQAYESITRAYSGDPNVLISRQGSVGELAVYGNGFYTRVGREGAANIDEPGWNIRFRLDPKAREGQDFIVVGDHEYVVVHNKAALRVIPESMNMTPLEFFRLLAKEGAVHSSDRALLERLRRRLVNTIGSLDTSEWRQVGEFVASQPPSSAVGLEYAKLLEQAKKHAELTAYLERNFARLSGAEYWEYALRLQRSMPDAPYRLDAEQYFKALGEVSLRDHDLRTAVEQSWWRMEDLLKALPADRFERLSERALASDRQLVRAKLLKALAVRGQGQRAVGLLEKFLSGVSEASPGGTSFQFLDYAASPELLQVLRTHSPLPAGLAELRLESVEGYDKLLRRSLQKVLHNYGEEGLLRSLVADLPRNEAYVKSPYLRPILGQLLSEAYRNEHQGFIKAMDGSFLRLASADPAWRKVLERPEVLELQADLLLDSPAIRWDKLDSSVRQQIERRFRSIAPGSEVGRSWERLLEGNAALVWHDPFLREVLEALFRTAETPWQKYSVARLVLAHLSHHDESLTLLRKLLAPDRGPFAQDLVRYYLQSSGSSTAGPPFVRHPEFPAFVEELVRRHPLERQPRKELERFLQQVSPHRPELSAVCAGKKDCVRAYLQSLGDPRERQLQGCVARAFGRLFSW